MLEFMASKRLLKPVLQIGLPDEFIKHGAPEEITTELGLDAKGIEQQIRAFID